MPNCKVVVTRDSSGTERGTVEGENLAQNFQLGFGSHDLHIAPWRGQTIGISIGCRRGCDRYCQYLGLGTVDCQSVKTAHVWFIARLAFGTSEK